jgi:CspA family cold shock protein
MMPERRQTTMTGTIKVKTDRGFGFIARDGETKDLFFHSKDLVGVTFDALQVGAKVEFDVVDGEKGPSAKNVKIVA